MKGLVSMLSLFILSCSNLSNKDQQQSSARNPANEYYKVLGPTLEDSEKAAKQDPSFEDVVKIIKTKKPQTIADFLKNLKETYPKYFENYALMYKSRSPQGASFQNPRAIVYGASARLLMAFNGHKEQTGGATVEIIEYSRTKGFLFREIGFVNEGYKGEEIGRDEFNLSLSNKDIMVTKANPTKCVMCHDIKNPRPIWESYFFWPGAYGSEDDNVFRAKNSLAREFFNVGIDIEKEALINFIGGNKQKDRYALLGNHIDSVFDYEKSSISGLTHNRPNLVLLSNILFLTYTDLTRKVFQKTYSKNLNEKDSKIIKALSCLPRYDKKTIGSSLSSFAVIHTETKRLQKEKVLDNYKRLKQFKEIFGDTFGVRESGIKKGLSEAREIIPEISQSEVFSIMRSPEVHSAVAYLLLKKLNLKVENWSITEDRIGLFDNGAALNLLSVSRYLSEMIEKNDYKIEHNANFLKVKNTNCSEIAKFLPDLIAN